MSIEKRLNNKSIVVPAHPFWEVFRTFGRDEIIAGLLAITATAILEFIFFSLNIPKTGNALLLLVLAGPIVENLVFLLVILMMLEVFIKKLHLHKENHSLIIAKPLLKVV